MFSVTSGIRALPKPIYETTPLRHSGVTAADGVAGGFGLGYCISAQRIHLASSSFFLRSSSRVRMAAVEKSIYLGAVSNRGRLAWS
jgi:hypothetical protein